MSSVLLHEGRKGRSIEETAVAIHQPWTASSGTRCTHWASPLHSLSFSWTGQRAERMPKTQRTLQQVQQTCSKQSLDPSRWA